MTVYRVIDGVMHSADAPEGATYMEVGGDIVAIDFRNKTYRRRGLDTKHEPWPELTYRNSDLTWTPCNQFDVLA